MAGYTRSGTYHPSFGTLDVNGNWIPVWEAIGVFGGAVGPTLRSAGYPGPATLPSSMSGGSGYNGSGSMSASWNWKLIGVLLVVSVVGFTLVHHLHWRE